MRRRVLQSFGPRSARYYEVGLQITLKINHITVLIVSLSVVP